jgi:hypothetical protein
MPPNKGQNAKKESGRAKKAENEAKKAEAAASAKEKKTVQEWSVGAKDISSKEAKKAKAEADAARKAANKAALAEEEASLGAAKKPSNKDKAGKKKAASVPAGPGAIAAQEASSSKAAEPSPEVEEEIENVTESFAATGIDDALDLLTTITAKSDKASVGQQAAGIERHPERRFKAAFEAYLERELPNAKIDHPGLRLNQYRDLIFKQFQKAPENPFNQATVDYNATKDDKVSALHRQKKDIQDRLRQQE